MKVSYISSACVLIESEGVEILCDPWLTDGAYYGSWCHVPPLKVKPEDFNGVDYIYISHIHPDHFDPNTLKRINKNIPVLINTYDSKFLKMQIERLGFNVQELEHNKPLKLNDQSLEIKILSADNCDPELCAKFMGCAFVEKEYKNTQIDSCCVIKDENYTLVNLNDCPWELAESTTRLIKNTENKIDFLLLGYLGASPYPQCFKLEPQELEEAIAAKKEKFFTAAANYIKLLNPKYYMPFAGRYTLGGKVSYLNSRRGDPELEEARSYLSNLEGVEGKCVIINRNEHFDLIKESCSKEYVKDDPENNKKYIKFALSKVKFDYENDPEPSIPQILELLPDAYDRFNSMRQSIGYNSDTKIIIPIEEDKNIEISCKGEGFKVSHIKNEPYFQIDIDNKLLKRALSGPKHAHWNNIEIGSHALFDKKPDFYERGLYYSLCFLHK